jgi:CubicO group peptidase (beta-lactamase class C family)
MDEGTSMTDGGTAADALVRRVRARRWGLAVAVIADAQVDVRCDSGDDPVGPDGVFDIGSITKTMTGLLLADAITRNVVTAETTVGDVVGPEAGNGASITLLSLATQRSGLPRLPPNLDLATVDRSDPYASYTRTDLLDAVAATAGLAAGDYNYSNYGFMLLALVLGEASGTSFEELLRTRIFEPLSLTTAGCPPSGVRLPGYNVGKETPWWNQQLAGAGGVGMSASDLGRYLLAHFEGSGSPDLDAAMELATTRQAGPPNAIGFGWVEQDGVWWHNGATAGFRSFCALDKETRTAVGLLANAGDSSLDQAGFEALVALSASKR